MQVLIRCAYCNKEVPYYSKLFRIERRGRGVAPSDGNYRYCSKECAEAQLRKEHNERILEL